MSSNLNACLLGTENCWYIEPLLAGSPTKFEFVNLLVGQAIPSGGFNGHPVENLRVVLIDGAAHTVDSNELAFKLASIYAFRQCYTASRPVILEPVMLVELKVPTEFQGAVAGDINKRKGVIVGNDQEGDDSIITAHWPDKKAYNETLLKLAGLFQRNLETFTNHKIGKDNKLTEEILAARPVF
ncbi:elongation factor G-1, mitochondrial-like [Arachis ipaensis]|uniref:elongation factor G-1, mitochondrial-like n=1 Tax=Arachis ipaensis TaxID=130454 RepID=UPI000A2B47B3|nr:elongation factor G-1, mitochondrial-like [Arachis ipaensis]